MTTTFKVACVQNSAIDDMQANIAEAETLVREAAAAGADLVCLPEYFCILEREDDAYFANGFSEDEHPALVHFRTLATELSTWLLLGSIPVKFRHGKVHNRSYVVDANGGIAASYDKIHLFDVTIKDGQDYKESRCVAPGADLVVAQLPWGRLGMSVCYDVRFPHLYRQLAKAGADFISIPAAFTAKTGAAHWHTLVRARAIETACYVFAPDQYGKRPWGRRTYGHSLIVDPWGEVIGDGGEDAGFVMAEVDPARVAEARNMIPALTHDREFRFTN